MKKILELIFCLVALVALFVITRNSDCVKNDATDDVLAAINERAQSNAEAAAECVSIADNQ